VKDHTANAIHNRQKRVAELTNLHLQTALSKKDDIVERSFSAYRSGCRIQVHSTTTFENVLSCRARFHCLQCERLCHAARYAQRKEDATQAKSKGEKPFLRQYVMAE
jgi:hypothetical protein